MNDAIHAELVNWSRWCWLGPWPHPLPETSCGSIESQYRSPPEWNPDDAPEAPYIRPHTKSAEKVHGAWEGMQEPRKAVLKAEYPGRYTSGRVVSRQAAAGHLGMPLSLYEEFLEQAAAEVEAKIAIRERGY